METSETLFQDIVTNIPGIAYQFQASAEGKYSFPYVSPAIFEYLGLSPDEVISDFENFIAIIHPNDLPDFEASILDSMRTMSRWEWEGRFIKNGNEERWFCGLSNPSKLEDGSVQWNGIFFDITESKRAEKELEISKNNFKAIAEDSLDGWIVNIGFENVFVNQGLAKMLGYENGEELISTTFKDIVHPSEFGAVRKRIEARIRGDKIDGRYETLYKSKNGEPVPVEVIATKTIWEGQEAWMVNARDITINKQAELLLKQSKEELEQLVQDRTNELVVKNAQYQILAENAADGIFIFDSKGNFIEISKHARENLGYTEKEIQGMCVFDIDPKAVPEKNLSVWESLKPGQISSVDGEHHRKDGSFYPVEVRTTAYLHNGEKYFIAIARDITERKRAEISLLEAKQEAERANEAKSEFLARMSHELRTPMNSILGFGQLLQLEKDELTKEQNDGVGYIMTGATHLLNLINEVLDIAKVDAGEMTLSIEPVSIDAMLGEALLMVQPLAAEFDVIINKYSQSQLSVMVDEQRIKQVLVNLLGNALKYNKPGGSVSTSVENLEEWVRVYIRDTGRGVKEEDQKFLFEPFKRISDGSLSVEGTGIGLTITQKLIELMGGSIGFESTYGEGSNFWIDLPRAKDV